ncbi:MULTISPECIES: SRPBCC family protein [unclassified Pseudomonas]|uniref:SRPBCC family protein n=1 Tax=unclassified Pseudomonas TaxID=196821 RepID=UPI00244A06C6|nr:MULTISPECIES: SRPBCC family protein [unclassified Pseudomonas]MDH0301677.1 SRPBCC family protein [Pseudomonas sp. GD04091]MDH1984896.1 SRPBCC family protein [Pseudomonas sp. GD03689]
MTPVARHSVTLALPHGDAWNKLRDLTQAPRYVPGLTGCTLHPGPEEGIGASRRVRRKGGQWLDESVVAWTEGGGFVLALHKGDNGAPFPFRHATFRYALEGDDASSRITMSLHYRLRGGRLAEWLMRRAFAKAVREIAENLKAYYESGQTQNPAFEGIH